MAQRRLRTRPWPRNGAYPCHQKRGTHRQQTRRHHRIAPRRIRHALARWQSEQTAVITIVDRSALQLPGSPTSRFEGADHSADVSMFWVHTPPGNGPDFHWHPYTETWVVLHGEVRIEAGDEQLLAQTGNIVTAHATPAPRCRSVGRAELERLCIPASPTIMQGVVTPPPSPRYRSTPSNPEEGDGDHRAYLGRASA